MKRIAQPPPNFQQQSSARGPAHFATFAQQVPSASLANASYKSRVLFYRPWGQAPAGYIPGIGRGATALNREEINDPTIIDRGDYSETRYDKWEGYQGSLFTNTDYDDEDKEADNVYSKVDVYINGKRRGNREALLMKDLEKIRAEKPSVSQQFADLKRQLMNVSAAEWEGIPEIEDYTVKKQKRQTKLTPVTDSVLQTARSDMQTVNFIDPRGGTGVETPMASLTNLNELGQARDAMLAIKLDKASDSVLGTTTVNKSGYLTSLDTQIKNKEIDINDLRRARQLMKSVMTNNPNSSGGWINAARIEELDGKIQEARNILAEACNRFLDNEDIWLEAARLSPPDKTKAILAKALTLMPHSEKLWLSAAGKESDKQAKSKVLRKALQHIPHSATVWKEAIELENEEDARVLLHKAVDCVPHNVDMWLALAKLENYENAKVVLNKARRAIPTDHNIWMHAIKLEEAQGNLDGLPIVAQRALKTLSKHGINLRRDQWIKEAQIAERSGSTASCKALIKVSMNVDVEPDERKRVWLQDAKDSTEVGAILTARAILREALGIFPEKKSIWIKAIELEREHGTKTSLNVLLEEAIEKCPNTEIFWLMAAKELWIQGNPDSSRDLLKKAMELKPNNEEIILAAAKLERESLNYENAENFLDLARKTCNSAKVMMDSAQLERERRNNNKALVFAEEGYKQFPKYPKLWLIAAQLLEEMGQIDKSRAVYDEAIKANLKCSLLVICAAKMEENQLNFVRARTLLIQGRIDMPENPDMLLAGIRLEVKTDHLNIAQKGISRALNICPTSGILWAEAIEMEAAQQRKAKSFDALNVCEKDPCVVVSVAKVFWMDRKIEKARKWLSRAVALNPDYGDAWAYLYKFEKLFGTEESLADVVNKCTKVAPRHGEKWTSVAKRVENWRLDTKTILKKVAEEISVESSEI